MRRVTEKIWSSDGGHRVPVLRVVLGINSSHKGNHQRESFAFYTYNLSGNDSYLFPSAPPQFISDMLLIFYIAITESWTSMALFNF